LEKKKVELEKRDQERLHMMSLVQTQREKKAKEKSEITGKKLEASKKRSEDQLLVKRKEFEERERKVEEQRKKFEKDRIK
jgi:hypothetical protein